VTVVVDGHQVTLRTGPGRGAYAHGLFWQGFFGDVKAETLADLHRRLAVHVRIVGADGAALVAEDAAPVSAGYG
jgi:hypothetical protein